MMTHLAWPPTPMSSLLSCLLLRPVTALAGVLLLNACSQTSSTTSTNATPTSARPVWTKADSLYGVQGHIFGEPVSNFPGLVFESRDDEMGESVYLMKARERGWLGQCDRAVITYYFFQDGKFAKFRAFTTCLGLREEVYFLFGPGKERNDIMGTVDWEGERVQARYSEKLEPPVMSWLEVSSKPLLAVRQAKQRAQMQADSILDRL